MTVEEKRACVRAYCKSRNYMCHACSVGTFARAIGEVRENGTAKCWHEKDVSESMLDARIEVIQAEQGSVGTPVKDNVNHPKHYELPNGLECIDVLLATQGKDHVMGFCLCNAMKYLYRHKRKNGVEDIKKARWYIDKYLELEGAKDE